MSRISFQPLDLGLRVMILAGGLLLALLVVLIEGDLTGLAIGAVLACFLAAIALLSGTTIEAGRGRVAVGFRPFYRTSFAVADITELEVVQVNAFDDFGGWGIKGNARRTGLLLSAGGSQVVRFVLADGRCYLVSCRDPETVRSRIVELGVPTHG